MHWYVRGLSCKSNIYVSLPASELRVRLVHRLTGLSPPVKYFYWPFQGDASFVDHLCYFCLILLCFHARLFVDALWSPARKGLTSWLSSVMSICDVVSFPLVSWVMCGAWLYRFLSIALFLTFLIIKGTHPRVHQCYNAPKSHYKNVIHMDLCLNINACTLIFHVSVRDLQGSQVDCLWLFIFKLHAAWFIVVTYLSC